MTRTVGSRPRDEFILDPGEAWRAGRRLDRSGAALLSPHPRGVWRAPHRVFNAMDDARSLDHARRVQQAPIASTR